MHLPMGMSPGGAGKVFVWELYCASVLAVTVLPEALPVLVEDLSMLCAPCCLGDCQGAWICVHGGG